MTRIATQHAADRVQATGRKPMPLVGIAGLGPKDVVRGLRTRSPRSVAVEPGGPI